MATLSQVVYCRVWCKQNYDAEVTDGTGVAVVVKQNHEEWWLHGLESSTGAHETVAAVWP